MNPRLLMMQGDTELAISHLAFRERLLSSNDSLMSEALQWLKNHVSGQNVGVILC